ncbi:MipA/OmpV family protein [Marinomonas sp. IMCC 4694]|uniref:MipA/OmpV family protein n=1 Tax=Marinomonas sp. IMCC 4694 TaxID=2605432 RepID=UPI0011E7A69C|nr:MipA/OmpV family protein [Marinomonas sp. IMCC 4694]TYL48499.1 MipA/OmpV family protein [Marinomonas sp. IMCC 4694]
MKKTLSLLLLSTPFIAQADVTIGVLGMTSQSIYSGVDTSTKWLPNISYEGEHLYFRYPDIGYRLTPKRAVQSFAIGLSYDPAAFDPSDSDNSDIQALEERDDAALAFASYRLGPISAKLAQDVSGAHNGFTAQIGVGYPIPAGNWKFIPTISYHYVDANMSQHLYGVSQSESTSTGGAIAAYTPGSTSHIKYGVRGFYPFSERLQLIINVSHTRYNKDIVSSPIAENDRVTSVLAGINFSF